VIFKRWKSKVKLVQVLKKDKNAKSQKRDNEIPECIIITNAIVLHHLENISLKVVDGEKN